MWCPAGLAPSTRVLLTNSPSQDGNRSTKDHTLRHGGFPKTSVRTSGPIYNNFTATTKCGGLPGKNPKLLTAVCSLPGFNPGHKVCLSARRVGASVEPGQHTSECPLLLPRDIPPCGVPWGWQGQHSISATIIDVQGVVGKRSIWQLTASY